MNTIVFFPSTVAVMVPPHAPTIACAAESPMPYLGAGKVSPEKTVKHPRQVSLGNLRGAVSHPQTDFFPLLLKGQSKLSSRLGVFYPIVQKNGKQLNHLLPVGL